MHISLDSALGRQRRLNSVGESVLQIAPNAAAAYSLRSLTGGDPKVVRVRRVIDNAESDFTAAGISSGALTSFVNDIQTVGTAVNGTGSFDNYTVSNLSNTGFSADNSAGGTGSAGFPYVFKDDDVLVVKYTVTNFSSTSSLSPALRGVSATNSITSKTNAGTTFTANGTYTDTLTATADGTHLMYADGNTGSYTISDFEIVSHSSSGFVETWYDQSGNSEDAVQETAGSQPKIVNSGSLVSNGLDFDGSNDHMPIPSSIISNINSFSGFIVCKGRSGFAIDTALAISKGSGTIVRLGNYLFGSATNSYASSTTTLAGTADDAKHLISLVVGDSNAESFLDGTSKGTISTASGYVADGNIGADVGSGNYWQGQIEEIIIYDSDQGSNRVVLETNIISHYGIS